MQDIPPSLIAHHPSPSIPAMGTGIANADGESLGLETDNTPSVTTNFHHEWMRPATAALTNSVAGPYQPQTFDDGNGRAEGAECLKRFRDLLRRRHGISADAATALCLATLSAAAGPGRTLKNPLGGEVSAALNVVVEDASNARIRRAAEQSLLPFLRQVERKIIAHQEAGPKHLRQFRMEIEQECARAVQRLRSPVEKPKDPMMIPVPADQRKGDAVAEAKEEAEQVIEYLGHFDFQERPFVVVDGLHASDIPALSQRSFDGAVLNFSRYGGALEQLNSHRTVDRREVLRYLVAAWHSSAFYVGSQAVVAPVLTNLWLLAAGDMTRAWRNSTIASSGLLETFLVIADHAETSVDAASCAETDADESWRTLVEVTLAERMRGESCQHVLSESAARRFLEFHASILAEYSDDEIRVTGLWPEQALKIALLLHLDTQVPEVPKEIDLTVMEEAISLIKRLGVAQLQMAASTNSLGEDLDAQIEIMVAKVRLHGRPLSKRDLFRKYNVQKSCRLEPILALCQDRQQLKLEGELIHPALPG